MAVKHTTKPAADSASPQEEAAPASAAVTEGSPAADSTVNTATGVEEDDSFDPLAAMFGTPNPAAADKGAQGEEDAANPSGEGSAEDKGTVNEDGDDNPPPAAGAKAPEDEEEDPEAAFDRKVAALPEEAQQIIHGLRKAKDRQKDKRKELQDQLDEAKAENTALTERLKQTGNQASRLEPAADDPLSDIVSEDDLARHEREARAALAWAEDNEDGWEGEGKDGKSESLSKKDVRAIRRGAEHTLNVHLPARRAWLKQHAETRTAVAAAYPETSGSLKQLVTETLTAAPVLKRAANHEALVHDHAFVKLLEQGKTADPAVAARLKKLGLVALPKTKAAAPPVKAAPPVPLSSAATPPAIKPTPATGGKDLATLRKEVAKGEASGADLMLAHWGNRAA